MRPKTVHQTNVRTAAIALAALAALLAAGCGATPVMQVGMHVTARSSTDAGGSLTAPPAWSRRWAAPPSGSRVQARAFGRRLLAGLVWPAGTTALPPGQAPVALREPTQVLSGGPDLADVSRLYVTGEPLAAASQFFVRHIPAGQSYTGQGSGDGPGSDFYQSVSYAPRRVSAWVSQAELDVSLASLPNGRTAIRADAQVLWYPPRSRAEYIDPRGFRAVKVSITELNPASTRSRAFTSAAVIGGLARVLDSLPAAPDVVINCPMLSASYQVAFEPAAGTVPRVVATPSGCLSVGMSAGGRRQPWLWGDWKVIAMMRRLLGLKPVPAPFPTTPVP